MLTISCYAFHPLAARFIHLWRYVQVVSNWLVFLLSLLCCQCGQFMPMSQCSSVTEAQMVLPIIDPGRASGEPLRAQHVVVDFSPQPQDKLVETRCMEMWSFIRSQPELEGTMISPDNQPVLNSPSVPVHKSPIPLSKHDAYPAVKEINKIQDTHPDHDHEFRFDYKYYERAGGWLKLHMVPATWTNARFQCHAEGAVLASPLTYQLRDAMLDMATEVKSSSFIYTGIHATYAQSVFTSIESVPLSRIPITWSPQAPHNFNYKDSNSCLVMMIIPNNGGTISDAKCSDAYPYICYKREIYYPHFTECGTVDQEYKFYPRTGRCYKFHRIGLVWSSAFKTCVAEGGNLAVIHSEEEFQILRDIYNNYPQNMIFSPHSDNAALGFSDPNDGTSWITIQGQTLKEAGFEQWDNGEPNNASQPLGELCGCMKRGNGKFNDASCNWPMPFICEKDPNSLKN